MNGNIENINYLENSLHSIKCLEKQCNCSFSSLNHGIQCSFDCECNSSQFNTLLAWELEYYDRKNGNVCCDIPMSFCKKEGHKRPELNKFEYENTYFEKINDKWQPKKLNQA